MTQTVLSCNILEFDNALVVSGAATLASVMAGDNTIGGWSIIVQERRHPLPLYVEEGLHPGSCCYDSDNLTVVADGATLTLTGSAIAPRW